MSLTWHIVRKDFLRMRLPLALWAAVLIVKNELGVSLLHGDGVDFVHFDLVKAGGFLLLALDMFMQVILVALLVQEDRVVSTDMFWATRPIGGGRLLAAKCAGAVLMFSGLPILISLRWWLACGYSGREIGWATLVMLDDTLLVTFVGFALASVTRDMKRFIVSLFEAMLGIYALLFGLGQLYGMESTVYFQRAPWMGVLLVGGVGSAVALQFLTRQLARSIAVSVAATVAAFTFLFCWPRTPATRRPVTESAPVGAESVAVKIEQLRIEPRDDDHRAFLEYKITGIPEDFGLMGMTESVWQWRDGRRIERNQTLTPIVSNIGEWRAVGLPGDKYDGLKQASTWFMRKGEKLGRGERAPGLVTIPLWFTSQQVAALQREPADVTSYLRLQLVQTLSQLELPATMGAQQSRAGYTLRVAKTEWRDEMLTANFVEARPAKSLGLRLRPGVSALFGWVGEEDQVGFSLVNRAQMFWSHQHLAGAETIIGTQWVRWSKAALEPRARMEGATLHLVRYVPSAWFEREVRAERLPVTVMEPLP